MTHCTFERRTAARRVAGRLRGPLAWRTLIRSPGPRTNFALLVAIVATPAVVLAWLLPGPLLLPALSIVSFIIAAGAAVHASWSGADARIGGIRAWDVAGAFALIWIAAGVLSEPDDVLQLFGHPRMAP
jgi:hypothetical protein